MTTPTPRTDAKAVAITGFYSCATVPADFARQLERELLTARDDAFNLVNELSKAGAEVERLRAELAKLKELLDEDSYW